MWFLRPGMNLESALITIAASLLVIFLIMPFHEIAHSFVAYKLGDDTSKFYGGLSLNLVDHLDLFGALSILLFGMSWSKPIILNHRNFKNPRLGVFLTSLAGPLFNIVAAFLIAILAKIFLLLTFLPQGFLKVSYYFFHTAMFLSLRIAIFNLLPFPTLDGFGVIAAFLPNRILEKIAAYRIYIIFGFILLLFFGILSAPVEIISLRIYFFITKIMGDSLMF